MGVRAVKCLGQRIIEGRVQFIRAFGAVGHGAHRHQTADCFDRVDDLLLFVFGQQSFGGTHANTVMAGRKVEVGASHGCRRHGALPAAQIGRIAGHHRVQDQRRQRKVIDRMRLAPLAEITQVFRLGHVGFGQKDDLFGRIITQHADQLNDGMGLWQMNRRRADFLPQERDGIEADDLDAIVHMQADDA